MTRRIPLAGVVAMMALAPAAHADKITFGSDLSQPATTTDSHPRDWAAFRTGERAPVQGEVTQVSFRGTVLKPDDDAAYGGRYPGFVFHVVVMRPQDGGGYKLLVSTENLPFPFGGDPQQVTTFNLQDYAARICVQPGDVVALATSGGFGNSSAQFGGFPDDYYSHGYPVQMFNRGNGGSYDVFKQPAGDDTFQVGDTVSASTQDGEELLMRTTIGTAADARWTCRTKAQQDANLPNPGTPSSPTAPPPSSKLGPAKVATAARAPRVRRTKVRIRIACPGEKPCAGTLTLSNRNRVFGAAPYLIAAGDTAGVRLSLNPEAAKQMRRGRGKATVKVTLEGQDGTRSSRRLVIKSA